MKAVRTNTAKWNAARERWELWVQRDGVEKRFTCTDPTKKGQAEANRKADLWLTGAPGAKKNRIRVADAIEEFAAYRASVIATRNNKPVPDLKTELTSKHLSTYHSEISLLRTWVKKDYGKCWLDSLGDAEMQAILDSAAAKGRSRKTVQDIRAATFQLIKFFRRRGQTNYRPDEVEVPRSARPGKKTILTLQSILTLFSSDETIYKGAVVSDPLIHAYRFLVLAGPRPGELIGLEWTDWVAEDIIQISRSINQYAEVTQGKNANALRPLKLPALAQQELRTQRIRCPEEEPRIFWEISNQEYLRDRWYVYCEHNKIPRITPYELRHTFVSIARKALPDYLLKPMVGHSRAMDTHGVYGHDFDGFNDETATLIGGVFQTILDTDKNNSPSLDPSLNPSLNP